jgi:hypothetical protein
LFEDGPVLRLGRASSPYGPLLKGLDETVVKAPDDKLTHGTLECAITY